MMNSQSVWGRFSQSQKKKKQSRVEFSQRVIEVFFSQSQCGSEWLPPLSSELHLLLFQKNKIKKSFKNPFEPIFLNPFQTLQNSRDNIMPLNLIIYNTSPHLNTVFFFFRLSIEFHQRVQLKPRPPYHHNVLVHYFSRNSLKCVIPVYDKLKAYLADEK